MNIVVTGSSGLIGRKLTRELIQQEHEVIEIDIIDGFDITNFKVLDKIKKFDVIVHLAAKTFVPDSYECPLDFYETNILGTLNTLELCRRHQAKIIFTSSYVYGYPNYIPIDERHNVSALNPYMESKIIGENLCRSYHRDFGLNVIILRLFNVYGPGQNEKFLIPSIISQAKSGIVRLMDPEPRRDYVFIDDVINAFIKAVYYNSSSFEVFNIGLGKSYSVTDIVSFLDELMPARFQVVFTNQKRKNEILDVIADIRKVRSFLGWRPRFGLYEGIKAILSSIE